VCGGCAPGSGPPVSSIPLDSMPIVTVELVADPYPPLERNLTQALADTVGHVLSSPPGQTWIRLRLLARNGYAENDALVDAAALPVFVTLLERHPPLAQSFRPRSLHLRALSHKSSVAPLLVCMLSTRRPQSVGFHSVASSFNEHAA